MQTVRDEIESFLRQHSTAEGRQLDTAIVFAESMLHELGVTVAGWEEAAARLRRLKRQAAPPCPN